MPPKSKELKKETKKVVKNVKNVKFDKEENINTEKKGPTKEK